MEVELLSITPNGEELVSLAFGTCTNKVVPVENIPKWMNLGHLSPLEHITATFYITEISRATLAQITRHRLASYSVQSMRYCDVRENQIITPYQDTPVDDFTETEINIHLAKSKELYRKLVDRGIPKQNARMILPIGTTTKMIMTANAREWLHIFSQRITPHAQWEIKEMCETMRDMLSVHWPNIIGEVK